MALSYDSKCCDICEETGATYSIVYTRINNQQSNDVIYDENRCLHVHKENGGDYSSCICSNGHHWNEHAINKCVSCDWTSSQDFVKWTDDNNTDNYEYWRIVSDIMNACIILAAIWYGL